MIRIKPIKPELKSIKGGYKDIDVVTVSEQLNQKGILEDVGGVTYLTQLAGSVPTTANTIYYCSYQLGAPVAINHIGTCFNRFFKAINKYNFNISLSIFRVRLNDF
ncbi:hypothetical protein ABE29_20620 [Cytobacillus firmus]|nr:DnaB-like helicase N-terminal domain-containing protein [Cytobacillus firmus]MBG9545077.1 hypothetical protein [Cytobacillus firmus]MBG9549891.1 hypothetical protein [Cytobacillus firmus]MBG9554144.1 hypothetical protein [Cytobacillus firmus]MBG9558811.1 hypothetical protein [Cytobacillus firmus]MBG9577279.1 hypothetical protein [Cytobacillus firmus]